MKILCLCATYGRPTLLANAVACFERQTHDDRFLLILDDAGQYPAEGTCGDRWRLVSRTPRCGSMPQKYNLMLDLANNVLNLEYDAIAIWDDDDIYLPQHLEEHDRQLAGAPWSYPHSLFALMPDLRVESTHGNHWAMTAYRREAIEKVGGWPDTGIAAWDHHFMSSVERECGPPARSELRTYIFRWASTGAPHLEWYIKSPTDPDAYSRMPQHETRFVPNFRPQFDSETVSLLKGICGVDV